MLCQRLWFVFCFVLFFVVVLVVALPIAQHEGKVFRRATTITVAGIAIIVRVVFQMFVRSTAEAVKALLKPPHTANAHTSASTCVLGCPSSLLGSPIHVTIPTRDQPRVRRAKLLLLLLLRQRRGRTYQKSKILSPSRVSVMSQQDGWLGRPSIIGAAAAVTCCGVYRSTATVRSRGRLSLNNYFNAAVRY